MGNIYSLQNTQVTVNINGGEQANTGVQNVAQVLNFVFGPQTMSDGTGAGLAKRCLVYPLTLTALANPTNAPTVSTTASGGTIVAGTYGLEYTYYNAQGETTPSTVGSITTTTATSTVFVTGAALPAGATGMNVYLTSGGTFTGRVAQAAAASIATITAFSSLAALPGTISTATIQSTLDLSAQSTATATLLNVVDAFNSVTPSAAGFTGGQVGINFGLNGAGAAGNGLKLFLVANLDTTPGQTISVQTSGGNGWTNGMGNFTLGQGPAIGGFQDMNGIHQVTSSNKLVTFLAKYGTPTLNLVIVGEGQ